MASRSRRLRVSPYLAEFLLLHLRGGRFEFREPNSSALEETTLQVQLVELFHVYSDEETEFGSNSDESRWGSATRSPGRELTGSITISPSLTEMLAHGEPFFRVFGLMLFQKFLFFFNPGLMQMAQFVETQYS